MSLSERFHWGWRIAVFYAAFAIVTLSFVAFAMTKNIELLRTDYYEYSLDHDKTMQARANGSAHAQDIVVVPGSNDIAVSIPATHVADAMGTIYFYRPNAKSMDHTFEIAPDASGVTLIPRTGIPAGKWTVTIAWTSRGTSFEAIRQLILD